jgi:hypothetical protein
VLQSSYLPPVFDAWMHTCGMVDVECSTANTVMFNTVEEHISCVVNWNICYLGPSIELFGVSHHKIEGDENKKMK